MHTLLFPKKYKTLKKNARHIKYNSPARAIYCCFNVCIYFYLIKKKICSTLVENTHYSSNKFIHNKNECKK